jgi:hypothetical protein
MAAPLPFIENAGQFASRARFQVPGERTTLWLAEDALWFSVQQQSAGKAVAPQSRGSRPEPSSLASERGQVTKGVQLKVSFAGANPHPRLEPSRRLATRVSYFLGDNPAAWRRDVPVWGGVRYRELYPGIDLDVGGEQGRLGLRLIAANNADLSAVRMRVEGADSIASDKEGHLQMRTAAGEVTLPLLGLEALRGAQLKTSVKSVGAGTFEIQAPFAKANERVVSGSGAAVGLLYSTYLGGAGRDVARTIAVDSTGNTYVIGTTGSADFPTTPGVFQPTVPGFANAYVAKLDPSGAALVYSTFLGGFTFAQGLKIAVDALGNAYVAGESGCGFPTTPSAFQRGCLGRWNVFVAKLNSDGTALSYATYIGGRNDDSPLGLAIDNSGNAYVAGTTKSPDFPTTPGAFRRTQSAQYGSAFVTKLNATGSALVYSTYLDGSEAEVAEGIAVDGDGNAYVTGTTWSANFPTTPGAFQTTLAGYNNAFVTKLNPTGSALVFSTYLGGNRFDDNRGGIALEPGCASNCNVYVAGYATSSNFPTTAGAFQRTLAGDTDGFITKLSSTGNALIYSTFLGGSGSDWCGAIGVDGAGQAYVAGGTNSTDFPTTADAFQPALAGQFDAVVAQLNPTGSALRYSTYLGGSDVDGSGALVLDGRGNITVAGTTASSDFPITKGAFQTAYAGGGRDAFVARFGR